MEKFLYKQILDKKPKINAWFAFPAIESFAMASLGYLNIFKKLDLMEDVFVERIYADTKTTRTKAQDVDVIGFSNSFEIDILAILKILEKYDIPFKSSDRGQNCPLIFAGGPVPTANPLPFQDFYDFVCIGDAENSFDEIFKIIVKKKGSPKEEILKELDKIESIWIPRFGEPKKVKRASAQINEPVFTPILSEKSFFKNTFVIEVGRGCPKMCNFCTASWHNLPARFAPADKIIAAIDSALPHTRKIALLGAYVAGHPDFEKILEHIRELNKIEPIELSVSSLRADLTDEKVVQTLVECGAKTATIAIEAGSDRLRKAINKDLSTEQIFKTVETARLGGLKGLKIYVMTGLPNETQEDIKELVSLMRKLKASNKGFELTLSLTTFVPKAHTPFQGAKRESSKKLEAKTAYLKKELHKAGIGLRPSSVEWDNVQAILSRYGKSLSDYLIEVYKKGGNLGAFKQVWRAFEKKGLLEDFEQAAILPKDLEGKNSYPWDFIEVVPANMHTGQK